MMFGHILIRLALLSCLAFAAPTVGATGLTGTFTSIDGGALSVESWRGRPVLVVNTASRCGFTGQYDGLQRLYERYRDRGLVVLAVPSNDFRQELGTAQEVKEFCALNFALDLPMTDITQVRGPDAHPFYVAVAAETGFVPSWNFNKILIGPDGTVVDTWRAAVEPDSPAIRDRVEALLD